MSNIVDILSADYNNQGRTKLNNAFDCIITGITSGATELTYNLDQFGGGTITGETFFHPYRLENIGLLNNGNTSVSSFATKGAYVINGKAKKKISLAQVNSSSDSNYNLYYFSGTSNTINVDSSSTSQSINYISETDDLYFIGATKRFALQDGSYAFVEKYESSDFIINSIKDFTQSKWQGITYGLGFIFNTRPDVSVSRLSNNLVLGAGNSTYNDVVSPIGQASEANGNNVILGGERNQTRTPASTPTNNIRGATILNGIYNKTLNVNTTILHSSGTTLNLAPSQFNRAIINVDGLGDFTSLNNSNNIPNGHILSGITHRVENTASNYTTDQYDYCIAVDCSGGPVTVNLHYPTFSQELIIKDVIGSATTNNITIQAPAGASIDGASTYVISTNYTSIKLINEGDFITWNII